MTTATLSTPDTTKRLRRLHKLAGRTEAIGFHARDPGEALEKLNRAMKRPSDWRADIIEESPSPWGHLHWFVLTSVDISKPAWRYRWDWSDGIPNNNHDRGPLTRARVAYLLKAARSRKDTIKRLPNGYRIGRLELTREDL